MTTRFPMAPPQSSAGTRNKNDEDEDSWEVRAFAEDTAWGMDTTWPPRSYACSFCKRVFQSAQALGGHMNVHRRDRARLHQTSLVKISNPNPNPNPSNNINSSSSTSMGSTVLIVPAQEFLANGGLCLLYQLRNDNLHHPLDPSSLISISPYHTLNNSPNFNIAVYPQATYPSSVTSTHQTSRKRKPAAYNSLNRYYHNDSLFREGGSSGHQHNIGELDLELRLGHGPRIPS